MSRPAAVRRLALIACWTAATVAPLTAGTVTVELESLKATVSAGSAARQEMSGFGAGWGGGAQLLWSPPAPVDQPVRNWPHLTVSVEVPARERYELLLFHTVAPDYGRVRVFVDGSPRADFDGHAPQVARRQVALGALQLSAGMHQLVFTLFAKADASNGFLVGLDRLELRSAGGEAQPGAGASAQETGRSSALRPGDVLVASGSDMRRRLLVEAGSDGQSAAAPLALSAQKLVEPGVAHLDLTLCDRLDSEPARILMHGRNSAESPGGEAHVSLRTTPGVLYLVSFLVGPGTRRVPDLGRFAVAVLEGAPTPAETTRTVAAPEQGLRAREIAIAFKARTSQAEIVLRRAEPGADYELRRVEITSAR